MEKFKQKNCYKGIQESPFNKGAGTRSVTGGSLKDNNGITIVSLIITIIVMLILASVTIYVGIGNIENSRMVSFVAYMQTIQKKVDIIAEYEDYSNYGEELTENNKSLLEQILNNENEVFLTTTNTTNLRYLRYFDGSHIASDLEIENVEDEIVVDFNTREVISLNGINYEDKLYYTQYNLPGGQSLKQNEETERDLTLDETKVAVIINGLNADFVISNIGISNGALCYGKEYIQDGQTKIKWETKTNHTKKGETYKIQNITDSGKYYFKLVDNITGKESQVIDEKGDKVYYSVELRLTNSPKLEGNLTDLTTSYNYTNLNDSSVWAFATDTTNAENLKYYVWIPRYAYKIDSQGNIVKDEDGKIVLEFLRGTSDVTTSGGYINDTEWFEPEIFTDGTNKKTGVWLQATSAKEKRHRYN